MPTSEPMLTVAEVLELEPGTKGNATWVEPGFTAVVLKIVHTTVKKNGNPMHICTLGGTNEVGEISMTIFGACRVKEGDTIEVSGRGLRRGEYNQMAQVEIGKDTAIHVIGTHVPASKPAARASQDSHPDLDEARPPAACTGRKQINGQNVGMAMKEAIALAVAFDKEHGPQKPEFWARVHQYASSVIRLSNALEHGNLTPALSAPKQAGTVPTDEAAAAHQGGRADPPKGTNRKPPAGENGEAFSRTAKPDDEDVPF